MCNMHVGEFVDKAWGRKKCYFFICLSAAKTLLTFEKDANQSSVLHHRTSSLSPCLLTGT